MIKYHEEPNPEAQYDEEWITVENQEYDEATLKQLWEELNIVFMSNGDAVRPIKIFGKKDNPLIVIGSEDDGTICFETSYGNYTNVFSSYWIDSLIADLTEAKKKCADFQGDI